MRTLAKVATRKGDAGHPLPNIFRCWEQWKFRPRRAQVTEVVGPPGGGKSALTFYYCIRQAERHDITTLYFSADTDDFTMAKRGGATLLRETQDAIEERLNNYDPKMTEILTPLSSKIRFSFETDPDYEHMEREVIAFEAMFGDYPDIIVVDNLMNVSTESLDEWAGMKEVTKACHRLARQTGSAVFILHHANESSVKNSVMPAKRADIAGKVAQMPENILTVALDPAAGVIRMAAVKNRTGPSDPNAESYMELPIDLSRMLIFNGIQDQRDGVPA